MPIAMSTAEANKQHYEVPADFYSVSGASAATAQSAWQCRWPRTELTALVSRLQLVMGPYKKYSCGYWPRPGTTFEESEVEALRLVCSRAQLCDRQRVGGARWDSTCSGTALPACCRVDPVPCTRRSDPGHGVRLGQLGAVHGGPLPPRPDHGRVQLQLPAPVHRGQMQGAGLDQRHHRDRCGATLLKEEAGLSVYSFGVLRVASCPQQLMSTTSTRTRTGSSTVLVRPPPPLGVDWPPACCG